MACVDYLTSEVNTLKLDYNLLVSRTPSLSQHDLLSQLLRACLQLLRLASALELQLPQGDQGPADDAGVLAAMVCVRLYRLGRRNGLFQAIVVLEYLLAHSRYNYEALVLVTRLYMYLGLGSRAMDRFKKLSIKNIQQATMPWLLFSEMSKLHPWPGELPVEGAGTVTFDPLSELSATRNWHDHVGNLSAKALQRAMSNQQHSTILGLLEIQATISHGTGRFLGAYQHRSIELMRGISKRNAHRDSSVANVVHDNRDRKPIPNYETVNENCFADLLPTITAHPDTERMRLPRQILLDQLHALLKGPVNGALSHDKLQGSVDPIMIGCFGRSTCVEDRTSSFLSLLKGLVSRLRDGPNEETLTTLVHTRFEEINQCLETLEEDMQTLDFQQISISEYVQSMHKGYFPSWCDLHSSFTIIEILNLISLATDFVLSQDWPVPQSRKQISEKTDEVKESCTRLKGMIHSRAMKQRKHVESSDFKDFLLAEFGRLSEEMPNESIEDYVANEFTTKLASLFSDSYADAFDGVLKSSLFS